MTDQLTRRRFSVDEYHWMARVGILGADDRVELLDGEIVEMAPIGPEHAGTVSIVGRQFFRRFDDVAATRIQSPIRLGQYGEPEPDLALVRDRAEAYLSMHPQPSDVFLVVEVADTSLASDQRLKVPLYASAGILELWIVDLPHGVVHVYRMPSPEGYHETWTAQHGESIAPLAFPDRPIAVADLLARSERSRSA